MFFPSSGYHMVVVRGPALEIRIDGVATKGKTGTDDISLPGGAFYVGLGGSPALDMHLAELLAVKGKVTDADVLGVEAYMKAKYKLTF